MGLGETCGGAGEGQARILYSRCCKLSSGGSRVLGGCIGRGSRGGVRRGCLRASVLPRDGMGGIEVRACAGGELL
jgi:hypothetical protein